MARGEDDFINLCFRGHKERFVRKALPRDILVEAFTPPFVEALQKPGVSV